MSDERSDPVSALLARALERPTDERDAFLDGACAGDADLRREVGSLLHAHVRMDRGFLEAPATERLGLAEETPPLAAGATVGTYRVIRRLGFGGGGEVYEAEQRNPHRLVALKVMRAAGASQEALARFLEEAEILARLNHPGIAHVYDAGVDAVDGVSRPYVVLERVEGAATLVAFADEHHLDLPGRLALFARVCDAVHHGHQRGIIHEDLKPANVLVDASGQPKVIDFGIARLAGTPAGGAGTLPYMSPERLGTVAHDADVRSDVYALGVLCFELVSGRLPHDLAGLPTPEAARRVRSEAPARLSSVNRRLRGELEAVVHRAIERDPDRRYASAAVIADDVRRLLAHLPVQAVPPRPTYLLRKLVRRHRIATGLVVALVVVSLVAAAVSLEHAADADRAREAADLRTYAASVAAAAAALRVDDVREARTRLEAAPEGLRRWEWRHLASELDGSRRTIVWPGHRVSWGVVSPDGARIGFWSAEPREVVVADLADGRERWRVPTPARALGLSFSRQGDRFCIGAESGDVEVRDAVTGTVIRAWRAHDDEVIATAFDAKGERLATGSRDKTARVWSLRDGALLATLEGHSDRVLCLEFLPDGARIVTGGREGSLRLWDAATGATVRAIEAHAGSVESVAVSPDGTRIVSGGRDGVVRLWDVTSGRSLASGAHGNNVRAVAYAPDGATYVSASWDRTVRLWRAEDGREVARLRGHTTGLAGVGYAAGGREVVSIAFDGEVKTWAATSAHSPRLGDQPGVVVALAFDATGRRLAAAGHDGTVRVWDVEERQLLSTHADRAERHRSLAFGADGTTVLTAPLLKPATLWSLGDDGAREIPSFRAPFAWMPGRGAWLGVGASSEWVVLDGSLGSVLERAPWPSDGPITLLAVAPSGRWFAFATQGGEAELWRIGPLRREAGVGPVGALAFTREGDLLARGTGRGEVQVLRTEGDHRPLWTGSVGGAAVTALAFSPDGSRLAVGAAEGEVRLWDVASGQPILVLYGLRLRAEAIAFSPDGRRLAAAGGAYEDPSGSIALWDAPP